MLTEVNYDEKGRGARAHSRTRFMRAVIDV